MLIRFITKKVYTMKVTQDEAAAFLHDILHMKESLAPSDRGNEKLYFLNMLIENFFDNVPFQCVTFQAIPEDERELPSVDAVKERLLRGEGGLCWVLNSFMYGLLRAVGYNANLTRSWVRTLDNPADHSVILVKGVVEEGDCYLVDVGFGYPTFHAIPLDFVEESPIYHQSFLTYKLVYRKEDEMYIRLHQRSHTQFDLGDNDGWHPACYFKSIEEEYSEMSNIARQNIFTNKDLPFWRIIVAQRWACKKAIAVKENVLLVEDSNHKLQPTKLETPIDTEKALKTHFPMLSANVIEKAIQHWICLREEKV